MGWLVEQISGLQRMWREGLTAADIGKRLGLTKGAVLGKVRRLALEARLSPIKRGGRAYRTPHLWAHPGAGEPRPAIPPGGAFGPEIVCDPLDPRPAPRPATREEYESRGLSKRTCAWPIGDPRESGFHGCDRRAVRGKPYCADHCAEAYLIPSPKPP